MERAVSWKFAYRDGRSNTKLAQLNGRGERALLRRKCRQEVTTCLSRTKVIVRRLTQGQSPLHSTKRKSESVPIRNQMSRFQSMSLDL